ncbi:GGDEF domain-containing protein [Shewanella insulae]|uniref:GGDEF domain-containing protein n=1 Tax=Shewanella insulae TaxID=2681496 RepID=UPI001EFDF585|nr:GGDEF domain-containing protein [Shewanella insulae]MCG9739703.1 GGDEF domain-containing protein [Shewanella insulae]
MAEEVDIDATLTQADQLKSSNPNAFSELLNTLEKQTLNPQQRYFLDYLRGYELTYQGKQAQSIEVFNRILNSNANETLKFRANQTLINIYAISQDWSKGLSHLSKNFQFIGQIKDPETVQSGLAIAAIFYNQIEQYELGLSYAEKLRNSKPSKRNACLANGLAIEAQLGLNQLEVDSPSLQTAVASCDEEVIMESFIHSFIATKYLRDGNTREVYEQLTPSLASIEQTRYPRLIAEVYATLASAYLLDNKIGEARLKAEKIVNLAKGLGNTQAIVTAYKVLYEIADLSGDYKTALDYHIKYAHADKAYLDDIKTKHLAFQLAEHQAAEQKSRIALLDRQNNLLLTEQQLARIQAENNRLFISLLIAIITLLGFWAYKSWTIQKRLKQLAEYDALTHVFNRGHFTQVAQSALSYCESSEVDLSYILFDLDNFKQINDKYGHAIGDWVLKKVAKACQAQGRKNDIFARIGGEEFCIALPGCDLKTAIKLAEACREAIATIDCSATGHEFNVTASFGITDTQMSGYKLERLINDADSAMYQSKETGRDRLCIFDPEAKRTIPQASHSLLSL